MCDNKLNKLFIDLSNFDNKYASTVSVTTVSKRMDEYADISHIKRLKEYYMPKIEEFAAMITQLLDSNAEVQNCILKFDQTICEKANKSEIFNYDKRYVKVEKWMEIKVQMAMSEQAAERLHDRISDHFADSEKTQAA